MAWMTWESEKRQLCDRVNEEVTLEARVVYPAEHLSFQPKRVLAHRCSKGLECNQFDKPSCIWAGTQPNYDPFA